MNRKYIRLIESSTYQYINRLRSCGALAATERGCSLKYRSFRSGSRLSRNNVSSAVIDCTAPRLPPLARARSTIPSKFSSAFKFAAGSSVTLNTLAATLSLAVPFVRTISNHFAFASLCRCMRLAYVFTRSSSAFFAMRSFSSSSPRVGSDLDFPRLPALPSSASKASLASYHAPPDALAFAPPSRFDLPPFTSPLLGIGPAPGFHGRFFPDGRSRAAAPPSPSPSPSSRDVFFPSFALSRVAFCDAFARASFVCARFFPLPRSPSSRASSSRVVDDFSFARRAAAASFFLKCSARKSRSSKPRVTAPSLARGANPRDEAYALTSASSSGAGSDGGAIGRCAPGCAEARDARATERRETRRRNACEMGDFT